jgi:hypothetical protein
MATFNSLRYAYRPSWLPAVRAVAISLGLAMFVLVAGMLPCAAADPASGQYVRTESGRVRCLVMANDQGHGGGQRSFARRPGQRLPLESMGEQGLRPGTIAMSSGFTAHEAAVIVVVAVPVYEPSLMPVLQRAADDYGTGAGGVSYVVVREAA